jgi:hypothetical protein
VHANFGTAAHFVTTYGEQFAAQGVIHLLLTKGHVNLGIFDADGNLVQKIAIVGTGTCVYRAVAASGDPELLAANRTAGHEAGKLTDEGLDRREIAHTHAQTGPRCKKSQLLPRSPKSLASSKKGRGGTTGPPSQKNWQQYQT